MTSVRAVMDDRLSPGPAPPVHTGTTRCRPTGGTMRKLLAVLLTATVAGAGLATPATAAPRHYTVTDLGTLGGLSTEVYDLNDKGVAVGRSLTTDGEMHAFSW